VRRRLDGFVVEASDAWRILRERFGETIKTNELRSIADVLCRKSPGLRLDRDAVRDGRVLVKWYEENLGIVAHLLPYVELRDSAERIIGSVADD
jgi:hypothetical protein